MSVTTVSVGNPLAEEKFELVHKSAFSDAEWRKRKGEFRPLRVPDCFVTATASDYDLEDLFEMLVTSEQTGGAEIMLGIVAAHLAACGVLEEVPSASGRLN